MKQKKCWSVWGTPTLESAVINCTNKSGTTPSHTYLFKLCQYSFDVYFQRIHGRLFVCRSRIQSQSIQIQIQILLQIQFSANVQHTFPQKLGHPSGRQELQKVLRNVEKFFEYLFRKFLKLDSVYISHFSRPQTSYYRPNCLHIKYLKEQNLHSRQCAGSRASKQKKNLSFHQE